MPGQLVKASMCSAERQLAASLRAYAHSSCALSYAAQQMLCQPTAPLQIARRAAPQTATFAVPRWAAMETLPKHNLSAEMVESVQRLTSPNIEHQHASVRTCATSDQLQGPYFVTR